MKILFLGEIGAGQTSRMRMRALERLGHNVAGVQTLEPWKQVSWLTRQLQRRLNRGSVVARINADVLRAAQEFKPELVWAEKQEFLSAETLQALRGLGAKLAHFNPDPYFSRASTRTRLMDEAISQFDLLFYCKSYERNDYESLGRQAIYMPLGYCDEVHRPLPSSEPRWSSMAGFLGGWEPRRQTMLSEVAKIAPLKIWGAYWEFLRDGKWSLRRELILRRLAGEEPFQIRRDEMLAEALQGDEVYDDDYARALTGSRIGLGFLRQAWPDQHTTRSFEIPACGSLLLADRTEEHRGFFEEGKEAEFFSSSGELLDKIKFYAAHDAAREKIAAAGYARCTQSGYDYVHRLKTALAAAGLECA